MTKLRKNKKGQSDSAAEEVIEEVHMDVRAQQDYYDYAVHVIEDRAIYAKLDGLKPVHRRLLWAAHREGYRNGSRFVKAAKLNGATMGNYHPHGDAAIMGALVTAVNQPQALFDGSGNWGTMVDDPAAPRYVETRLSKYAERVFFDRFYLNTIYTVPNYDDTEVEPLLLTTLLPNALINGNFGIAPGVRTQTPTFTLASVCKVLLKSLKDGATPKTCLGLEFTTEYGGVLREYDGVRKDLLSFFKTGKGKFTFDSVYEDMDDGSIRIDQFAPLGPIDGTQTKKGYKPGLLDKVANVPGVDRIRDDSDVEDRYNAYVIEFKKGLKGKDREDALNRVMGLFSGRISYNVQVVERVPDEELVYGKKTLQLSNIPDMMNHWIDERIHVEKKACKFWAKKRLEEIAYLNLLRLAVKNRSFIIKALDKKLDDEGLAKYIAKGLKITVEQANQILDLKVRQLKALEDSKLVAKIKELKAEVAEYKDRIKHPKKYIATHIKRLYKELA